MSGGWGDHKKLVRCDPMRTEVVLRVGLSCLLSYGLSIADIPRAVPPTMTVLLGMFGPITAFAFPHLLFAVWALFSTALLQTLFAAAAWTMLLAAATVSDGLYVAVCAVYVLWVMGLHFGDAYDRTAGSAGFLVMLPALISLSFRVPAQQGGLDFVRGLWTNQGTENPLAYNRNFLIAACWGSACAILGILLPPVRTARNVLSQTMVPAALMQATSAIIATEDAQEHIDALHHLYNMLRGKFGAVAGMTIFEPHLCSAPGEFLVTPLNELVEATSDVILAFLALLFMRESLDLSSDSVKRALQVAQTCAKALRENDVGALKSLETVSDGAETDKPPATATDCEESADYGWITGEAMFLQPACQRLRSATSSWLRLCNQTPPAGKKAAKNWKITSAAWVLIPFLHVKRLVEVVLVLPFHPERWNRSSFLYGFKRAAGFMVLVCMAVYWTAYSSFRIETSAGNVGAVYSGCTLIAYSFTWTPTVEGTFHKGLQRLGGTCLGAFAAWIGIIVWSWSYDNNPVVNPYGLVTYLTFIALMVAYFGIDASVLSYFGMNSERGYDFLVILFTCNLIALEVYRGVGSRDGLTVNRLVANVSGILMAVVFQMVPPIARGGVSKHARAYCQALESALIDLLDTTLNNPEKLQNEEYQASLLDDASDKQRFAAFVLKDAATAAVAVPIYRVDPSLEPLLEALTVDEAVLRGLIRLSHLDNTIGESKYRKDLECVLDDLRSDGTSGGERVVEWNTRMDPATLFLLIARFLAGRLVDHQAKLDDVRWPYRQLRVVGASAPPQS